MSIELQNVSYIYPNTTRYALKNVSVKIDSGQSVCITGYGGGGTSTLINLAATVLHNFEGSVLFNGITSKNIDLMSLRSFVGENLSNSEIMNGTIAENISMGRDDILMSDVIEASEMVGLKDFIQGLPEGYHTRIIQNDLTIPDSVAIKINIARSIAENPSLFIMDKPLELLEKKDKELISDVLTDKDKDWTFLVASNNPVLAEKCDKIIVIKEGEVLDQGTFEEIKTKSYYNELFER
jgi:ABC-type multidrug transport system fused ATPase/permease subunit